jgi:hypothetical protein
MSTRGRFKRSLLGYRVRHVNRALDEHRVELEAARGRLAVTERRIAERDLELRARRAEIARTARQIVELDQVAGRLAERVVERERELRDVRAQLERERERSEEGMRTLAALAEDLAEVRRQARSQATRMRLRALREAAELTDRIGAAGGPAGGGAERLIDALEAAIARIGAEEEGGEELIDAASSNGHVEREAGDVFEGLVEVEVGPIHDFSQLVGFEDAAAGIGATSEVSVRRFTQGRATLSMRFKHPVELLRELEERAPFEFRVRDTRADRIVLDVDE